MDLQQKFSFKFSFKKFLNQKKQALSKKDKSAKKEIDEKAKEVVDVINKNDFMFTTSSCAGRAILMRESGKKQKGAIIKAWHEKIKLSDLQHQLEELKHKKDSQKDSQMIYFKFEPPIYHVICFDFDTAAKLVNIARQIGFKKSGFYYGKRKFPVVEIRGSEEISLPIFFRNTIVDSGYLKLLIKEVNKKFEQIWKKQKKLKAMIKNLMKDQNIKT